jgi:hypothetical protein
LLHFERERELKVGFRMEHGSLVAQFCEDALHIRRLQ